MACVCAGSRYRVAFWWNYDSGERVLPIYIRHYNEHRPRRSLQQRPPIKDPLPGSETVVALARVQRRDVLGGLVHEYEAAAW